MEFNIGDIVIVTVNNPDGSKTITYGNMGIIVKKEMATNEIDYTVHTRSSDYIYGFNQLRLATQEEKNKKLNELLGRI